MRAESVRLLALGLARAQEIHEQSWYAPSKSDSRFREGGLYMIDHRGAAKLACEEHKLPDLMVPIVYYLNLHAWNDVQTWIQEVIKHEHEGDPNGSGSITDQARGKLPG